MKLYLSFAVLACVASPVFGGASLGGGKPADIGRHDVRRLERKENRHLETVCELIELKPDQYETIDISPESGDPDFVYFIPKNCGCKAFATYAAGKLQSEDSHLVDLWVGKAKANPDGSYNLLDGSIYLEAIDYYNWECATTDVTCATSRCTEGGLLHILFYSDTIDPLIAERLGLARPNIPTPAIFFASTVDNVDVSVGSDCVYDPDNTAWLCDSTHVAYHSGSIIEICPLL